MTMQTSAGRAERTGMTSLDERDSDNRESEGSSDDRELPRTRATSERSGGAASPLPDTPAGAACRASSVQVLVGFLLTVPFAQRFPELDEAGRWAVPE